MSNNLGGRPREYDRDQIAEEMIEWAQLPDSINLCGFSAKKLIPPSKITAWARECEKFRLSYEIVKAIVGERRERLLSSQQLHVKAYDLNAKTYDHFLKEEHKEEKTFESSLRKEEDDKASKTLNVNITSYSDNKSTS